jgi:hypothetical protein
VDKNNWVQSDTFGETVSCNYQNVVSGAIPCSEIFLQGTKLTTDTDLLPLTTLLYLAETSVSQTHSYAFLVYYLAF